MFNLSLLFTVNDHTPEVGLDRHQFLMNTAYAGHGAGQLRGFERAQTEAAMKSPLSDRIHGMFSGTSRPQTGPATGLPAYRAANADMLAHRLHL